MAVKAVHFFRVTAVVFQWLHLDLTAGPHPRFLVQSHILSADAPSSSKMVEKTEQNTLFKTSPEKRLHKSKKPCESARERSDKYSLHFHLVMWERALRTVTYSTSSTTTFSNESRWKSALQVAHLLFHNDNESEKHFSDSLHFRFISSTTNTTVLRPKSAKNLQTAKTTLSSSISQWNPANRQKRKTHEPPPPPPAGQNSESNRTDLPKHTTRRINREPLTQFHNEGERKTKKCNT
jgi:hypothetical protein